MNNPTVTYPQPPQEVIAWDEIESQKLSKQVLPDVIKGVETRILSIPEGETMQWDVEPLKQVFYFLVKGEADAVIDKSLSKVIPKDLYVPKPDTAGHFSARSDCQMLEIRMQLREEEQEMVDKVDYPMVVNYEECEQYRDYFKSEKTVSRTLIHPFVLPRFSMGSVETTGVDRIQPHAHPILDQLFYSFSDNSCTLLIDGKEYPFTGDCLLHIPLGSDHGVDAKEGDVVNYLWIDFFDKHEDQQYLVEVHKPVEKKK